ncbi:phage holin family protein [Burkholderia ubonensis]|nr:phage holin family protein [Burkholderia ubonensis]
MFRMPYRGNSGGFSFFNGGGVQDHEKTILEVIIMGGLIGVAKVLVGSE